jgi:hypothetical protein
MNFITCFRGSPLPHRRNPAIVVWDIENVRLPLPPLSTTSAIQAVKRAFDIDGDSMMVCAVTQSSLRAMEKTWPSFLREMVPLMDVRLGCASRPKLGADFVLRRELSAFMDRNAAVANKSRIVLLTGDGDYLEPVQQALRLGFDVQLVHYGPNTSPALLAQPYVSPPVEWVGFLADALNGGVAPAMPYETKEQRDAKAEAMEEAKAKAMKDAKDAQEARRKAQEETKASKAMEKAEAKARAREESRERAEEAKARAAARRAEEEAKARAAAREESRAREFRRIYIVCACLIIIILIGRASGHASDFWM